MKSENWVLRVTVPRALADDVEEALGVCDEPPGIAAFAREGDPSRYEIEAYFGAKPSEHWLKSILPSATESRSLTPLEPRDWVSESQSMLPPITAGRFHVYGAHAAHSLRSHHIGIRIEAGQAFGTGRHETSYGCLLALDRLRRRITVSHALDLGTGSAILAIAIAKAWRADVIAADIDPIAVKTARTNIRFNHLRPGANGVRPICAAGLDHRAIAAGAPYPLIVANILAPPLIALSRELAQARMAGGRLILSGLLKREEPAVLSAYARQGLFLEERIRVGNWPTLILK